MLKLLVMLKHTCRAIAITCIDFRFQDRIENWLKENLGPDEYDRVALAGGVFDFYVILKQVEISSKLHDIQKVILMNHEDCGAYGAAGTFERHQQDLIEAEKKIERLFPELDVETYFLHLDGTITEISQTHPRHHKN
jgi:carbonic anhydrase